MKDKILKKLVDLVLDKLEDKIAEKPDPGDALFLEIIGFIRLWLNVPDND